MVDFNFDLTVGTTVGGITGQTAAATTSNTAVAGGTMTFTFTVSSTTSGFFVQFNAAGNSLFVSATDPTDPFGVGTGTLTWQDTAGNQQLNGAQLFSDSLGGNVDLFWLTAGGGSEAAGPAVASAPVTGLKFVFGFGGGFASIDSIMGAALVCFGAGTAIATPDGARAVEALQIGDVIRTADGDTRVVKWIGYQTFDTRFGVPDERRPVRVLAGALGEALPERDLVLTADHALLLDGLLINAGALVNGETIIWEDLGAMGQQFTVYHIETEDHAVILAEGVPAETYIDYVTRARFDNYAEFVALYGDEPVIAELPHPRVSSARMLPEETKRRLVPARAA